MQLLLFATIIIIIICNYYYLKILSHNFNFISDYDEAEGTLFAYEDDSDDDYDPDDESEDESDSTALSPFDQIDELAFFLEHLCGMRNREPHLYNQLMGGLSDELKGRLGKFEEEVSRRQAKAAAAAAE